MPEDETTLVAFFRKYIKGTPKKAPVVVRKLLLARLGVAKEVFPEGLSKIYISSFCIKHLYDKRPAEEFDKILPCLGQICQYPEEIYENKSGKRGKFLIRKKIGNDYYIASVEIEESDDGDGEDKKICVATAFRQYDAGYLSSCSLLWSWKGGEPSS
ncbi:hypothetical protein A2368_03835 [Candidatus Collierbacteria bacterium RIFOXYB1_FULL_49_13]|uniref:Phage-Barnase-EndoU-ColicinE5/D-RelE like nuclease 3 domain-containing protein n=1 Tax=Candidatus Collierbacteria bacterium RIFOXYB1_FULL_49_13 TaxID=1817728 RepID=A0A1F5FJA1_9BACT|nr:MAG: hypothetical protein A2368_03835 [Candidatus Collierbacteria bacterium RIFOXYB1_FULL_49_13]